MGPLADRELLRSGVAPAAVPGRPDDRARAGVPDAAVTVPKNEDEWRWAEALAIDRLHGPNATHWVAAGTGALTLAGDTVGLRRFREIARRLDLMLAGRGSGHA